MSNKRKEEKRAEKEKRNNERWEETKKAFSGKKGIVAFVFLVVVMIIGFFIPPNIGVFYYGIALIALVCWRFLILEGKSEEIEQKEESQEEHSSSEDTSSAQS